MIGSVLLVDFASKAEVEKWIEADPYVAGNVWKEVTIVEIKLAF
jgi:uncharacterized protein YciI